LFSHDDFSFELNNGKLCCEDLAATGKLETREFWGSFSALRFNEKVGRKAEGQTCEIGGFDSFGIEREFPIVVVCLGDDI
jgi:hypothetical protein